MGNANEAIMAREVKKRAKAKGRELGQSKADEAAREAVGRRTESYVSKAKKKGAAPGNGGASDLSAR